MSASLAVRAELSGLVNAGLIELAGSGTIDKQTGRTETSYILRAVPEKFSPLLLSACLITGYPNASRSLDMSPNIFSGHSYGYSRHLQFRGGGELRLTAHVKLIGDQLDSTFTLEGIAEFPSLISVEPLVESWEPRGQGRVQGCFQMLWATPDGNHVIADATTAYEVEDGETQPHVLHRLIEIRTELRGAVLRKFQQATLFRKMPDLEKD